MRNHFHMLDSTARARRWRREHPDYDHNATMARNGLAVATAGDLDRMATKYPDRYGRLVGRMSDRES